MRNRIEACLGDADWPVEDMDSACDLLAEVLASGEDEGMRLAAPLVRSLSHVADPPMSLRHWVGYARRAGQTFPGGLPGLFAFLRCNVEHLHFLTTLLSFSRFLADIVVRHPEHLEWAFRHGRLEHEKRLDAYREELRAWVEPFPDREARRCALCRYRQRELLRIGIRDLRESGDVPELTRELSALAQAACELAHDDCRANLVRRHGEPISEMDGSPVGFAVIGMGKLGGEELNFSSDIDLNYVYGDEGETRGVQDATGHWSQRIPNHQFFCRLAESVTTYVGEATPEGVMWRVDTRLRPEGAAGALARSLAAYAFHFGQLARTWEKIAYLRARPVAGDELLGRRFLSMAEPFVYTDNHPEVVFTEVARLKRRIDHERLDEEGRRLDIKRGWGGIREIEFTAAALQLLHGQTDRRLRVRPTVQALHLLVEASRLPGDDAAALEAAYLFLRRVEHCLQMMDERQTHRLPADEDELGELALRCGIRTAGEFSALLESHRRNVRRIFDDHFGEEAEEEASLAEVIVSDEPPSPGDLKRLEPFGVATPEAFAALRSLGLGSSDFAISRQGQRGFEALLPKLLAELPHVAMPEAAIRQFDHLLRGLHGAAAIFDLVLHHPPVLRLFLRLLGSGSYLGNILLSQPDHAYLLLSDGGLSENRKGGALLRRDVAAGGDVRVLKRRETLILGAQELLGILDAPEACLRGADLADAVLQAVAASRSAPAVPWCILALGGLGGRDVHPVGDLDITIVCSDGAAAVADFASEVMREMSAITPQGHLWKVDARLRPDGASAPLAASMSRFLQYYDGEAGVWEWQSLMRARPVAGDFDLGRRLLQECFALMRKAGRFPSLAQEVLSMRRRLDAAVKLPSWAEMDLKRSPGGLVDVEFVVQFLQLKHGGEEVGILTPVVVDALARLESHGLLADDAARALTAHYNNLRMLQRTIRYLWETPRGFLPAPGTERREILERALASRVEEPGRLLGETTERMRRMRTRFGDLVV